MSRASDLAAKLRGLADGVVTGDLWGRQALIYTHRDTLLDAACELLRLDELEHDEQAPQPVRPPVS